MSRSGYSDDCDGWALICWRGAVESALRGKRGQAFLRELSEALDALSEKRLIADNLERDGEVCAIGAVGRARGLDMSNLDPYEPERLSEAFDIACAMAQEISWVNDESGIYNETPEERFQRVRRWVNEKLAT